MHAEHGRGNRLVVKKDMVMENYIHTDLHTNTHMHACMQKMVVKVDFEGRNIYIDCYICMQNMVVEIDFEGRNIYNYY